MTTVLLGFLCQLVKSVLALPLLWGGGKGPDDTQLPSFETADLIGFDSNLFLHVFSISCRILLQRPPKRNPF